MTERSGNEIAVCVTKAARGAGVALADAEDLGAATIWLQGNIDCISNALEAHLAGAPASFSAICDGPVAISQWLADPKVNLKISNVDFPEILYALARQAGHSQQMGVACDCHGPNVCLTLAQDLPLPPSTGRAEVDDKTWARLSALVARTFVPATEASRLAGAGAGLTDND